ncbi:uncharacterized protein LOC129290940 [Prosopis cineraria]|uniref:uncharacterized protein LOC129290940 n=1 Tax=Prosopis cineraria TaxID=364024 RepID=UPI00240F4AEE|nr:uncharacterized protein LOC129290940 [Prosopis cineraria]
MGSDIAAKHELDRAVFGRKWKEVAEIFRDHPQIQPTKITKSEDNALHLAITLDAPEATVIGLIDHIVKNNPEVSMEIIAAKNKQHDTPLHCAASRGSTSICQRIIQVDEKLVLELNNEGETPLFLAALNGHTNTFMYLHSVCRQKIATISRKNGDTILHCTIQREYFELAYKIISLYGGDGEKNIVSFENKEGITPLQVLASVPSAFKSVSCLLSEDLGVEQLKNDDETQNQDVEVGNSDSLKIDDAKAEQCLHVHGITTKIGSIKKIKEKHLWGRLIMEKLLHLNSEYKYNGNESQIARWPSGLNEQQQQQCSLRPSSTSLNRTQSLNEQGKSSSSKKDHKSTALLVATKYGLLELVEKILEELPVAIYDKTEPKKRNVVHTAVQKRQTHVLKLLMIHPLWDSLIEDVDADGNNVLHMAAFLPKHMPWEVHGSAMQMQYEAKWYRYVKERVPAYLYAMENKEGDTPEEIFVAEHKKLLKESNEWIKDTSSSYSIVAALTAGVTYATSYTVPGGTNDNTGRPALEGQLALNIFVVSIFVSFCFSITSLAAFLAVFSSRKQPDDFRRNLPLKLCFALTSFYVAVVSIMVSFCSAHSLEVEPRIRDRVMPVYSLIIVPLFFYTLVQIPLYWDLLVASFTTVPQPRLAGESITMTVPKKRSKTT